VLRIVSAVWAIAESFAKGCPWENEERLIRQAKTKANIILLLALLIKRASLFFAETVPLVSRQHPGCRAREA
jgi:hypothetical protein